ncbi:MAG: ABC transporter transmembrane domain-containing protein [Bacteroidota bacterium]
MFGRNREKKEKPKFSKETFFEGLKVFEFIKPYRWYFIGGMILLTFSSLLFMVFPFLFGQLVDAATGEAMFGMSINDVGILLLIFLPLQGIIGYFRAILFAHVSEKGTADIRKALYKRLVSFPISFFEENKTGSLISRVTADVDSLYNLFSVTLAEFIRQIITLIVGILFIAITMPRLSLVMLLTLPVVIVFAVIFGRYLRKISKVRQKKLADSNGMLSETAQSIQVVKSFANEWFEINRYYSFIQEVVKMGLKLAHARGLFAGFIITAFMGAIFFIIWQGVLMLEAGTITHGDLVSFVAYTAVLGGSMGSIASFVSQLFTAFGATERVREILNTEAELELGEESPIAPLDIHGDINLEFVQFRYPTRTDVPVLEGVDMEIKSGQKVALVGPSGAGKSTIIQLLLQFYPIQQGDIKVDGKSIYDYDLRQLRNKMALVPQDVILFGGTIKENILYGREEATNEEVIEAAKKSNSWEFIENFPEGLETIVGERGVKLSGGQRQRIAIARAILKDPAILLLDEATSALDAESEKIVQEALENLMEGRTSIIIAHRLSTIKDVDCIFVLEDGKIVERGRHDELLGLEDGAYFKQAQLAGLN